MPYLNSIATVKGSLFDIFRYHHIHLNSPEPFAGCSNMLTSVYLDPEDLRAEEPVLKELIFTASVYAGADKWEIGEAVAGSTSAMASLDVIIDEHTANSLQLIVTGADGKTAEIWPGGVMKVPYTFDDVLNDGFFGLSNINAHREFTIDMTPSNRAPYARKFEEKFSRSAVPDNGDGTNQTTGEIRIDVLP